MSPASPALHHRSALIRAGRDDHVLRRRARDGELVKVAPGTYVDEGRWAALGPGEQHLLRARAVLGRLASPVVASHETALAFHGFPLLGAWPDQVHVVDPRRRTTLTSTWLVRHAVELPSSDIAAGVPRVVTAVRAAVDVVRSRDLRGAAVVLDHGLRTGAFTRDEAREALDRRRSSPGSRAAALAIEFADPLSESPGESLSRAGFRDHGIAEPVLQHEFRDARGFIGRVDFWWPCCGVVGEFDGMVKYSGRAAPGGRPSEAVVKDEKAREDRIRALPEVDGFARWDWMDALRVDPMLDLVRAAGLARCTHRRRR